MSRQLMRWAAAWAWPRAGLNRLYAGYTPPQRQRFYARYAKIFRGRSARASAGAWRVVFNGRPLRLPLTPQRLWLDWDLALSIVGHDWEVKQTYAALLNSPRRPELFVDIGANYGTHSLLFLSQGVEALAFEPNAACHAYFEEICRLNGVAGRLEPVALGDFAGPVELCYPPDDTWIGSIHALAAGPAAPPASEASLRREVVRQETLDAYLPRLRGRRALLKIDVEGAELAVLRGAAATLAQARPLVIFESLPDGPREALWAWLAGLGCAIQPLPWSPGAPAGALSAAAFGASAATNFIALPGDTRA